jgi:hypothetical protein
MAREAGLFESAAGSPLGGYLILKKDGGNVPPTWIERSKLSRRERQKRLAPALRKGGIAQFTLAEDWELAYRKECFYRGIRILFELERLGESRL